MAALVRIAPDSRTVLTTQYRSSSWIGVVLGQVASKLSSIIGDVAMETINALLIEGADPLSAISISRRLRYRGKQMTTTQDQGGSGLKCGLVRFETMALAISDRIPHPVERQGPDRE